MRLCLATVLAVLVAATPAGARDKDRPLALADAVSSVGQWEMAARMYREATLARPDEPAGWIGLGRALLEGGRPVEALASLRRAETLKPASPGLQHLIGRAAIEIGKPQEAEAAFRAAAAQAPADQRAWVGFGVALDLLARRPEAQAAYAKALVIDPLSVAARNNLALSRALEGQIAEAKTRLRAIGGSSPRVRANLALLDAAGPPRSAAAP